MHQRLETKPTDSTTQMREEEGFDALKNQRNSSQYTEQRASKRDLALEHTRQDVPSHLNEPERQRKGARETEAIRQELSTKTNEIGELDEKYADLPIGKKAQALTQLPEPSNYVIHENQKEAEHKETRFQEVRKEIEQTQQALSEINQRIEAIETYQQALEKETQTSPHSLTTTHILGKQVALLDTAITSLQQELDSKQLSPTEIAPIRQKIKDFSAQKRDYQEKKTTYPREERHIPDIKQKLAKTQDAIKQHENELSELDIQLKEIKEKRDSVQKGDIAPLMVARNFADQLTMTKDHIRYLEQEIKTKQTAQPDEDLTSLQKKLNAEQKYVDDLLAEKVERANTNREIDRPIEDELKVTLTEITAFKRINVLFEKEKDILQRADPDDSIGMQSKIDQHLADNKKFLSSSTAYKDELEELLEGDQATPGSLDAQRHGIYTLQDQHDKGEQTTLLLPIELQKNITLQKIGLMNEQLETIQQLWNRQKSARQDISPSHADASKKPRKLTSAEVDYLQKLHRECIDQLQAGKDYHDNLEQNSELYATKTIVNRPLSEQLAMVQNLKHLYEQDTSQLERLLKLTNYQQTLEMLRMRQHKVPERLDKQIEMVKDHISFLDVESMVTKNVLERLRTTAQRPQENKADSKASLGTLHDQIAELTTKQDTLSSQLAAEKLYLQELDGSKLREKLAKELDTISPTKRRSNIVTELGNLASPKRRLQHDAIRDAQQRLQDFENTDSAQIRSQTAVTRNVKDQLTMLDNLIKHLETRRVYRQNMLQQSQQSKNNLEQSIQKRSSDQLQVHPTRDTQHELVKRNLQHLRQKSQQYTDIIHEKDSQKETLRARLIHLYDCNDILAKDSLSSINADRDKTHVWEEHKKSLQAEIQQLQQDSFTQDKTHLAILQERLRQAELLDKHLQQGKDNVRATLHMQQTRAWEYAEKLDLQRDHLQHLYKKIDVINDENNKRLNNHMKTFRKYYALHEWKQFQEFDTKKEMLQKQLGKSKEVMQQIARQFEDITTKIRHTHELLKFLADRKNESKHSFFLNEHMIPLHALDKFDISPVRVFMGTEESMCLPSCIRMICYDKDPSFATKVKEVTDALNPEGNGSASIDNAPHALQKLGHPVPYETIGIDSIHQLFDHDKIKFDQFGNSLPFIIGIERPDKPAYTKHGLVCHRIIELNEHRYAVLRDPLMPNAFAIRLEHLDEVLMRSEINAVVPV